MNYLLANLFNRFNKKEQMKNTILILFSIFGLFFVTSCKENEARRPISRATGTFLKESVERNIKLNLLEEKLIDSIIKSQPEKEFLTSDMGYWYYYNHQNTQDTLRPQRGDIAYFTYDVSDLKGNIIYTESELKNQTYLVDKQNIMTGLRDGIKRMRKNETITFYFPSHIAYGYHGDKNKIGTNIPLICRVTLHDFKKENEAVQQ